MRLRTTLPLRRPTIITPPLGVPTPHTKTLTVGTTTAKTSASLLFEPISDGKSHVADVGPSAHHAASTHLEPEASHGLNLEDSVVQRKQVSSETGTKRKRAWGVADEVNEVNTESEKVDTKPDSSSSRLNLSSESDVCIRQLKGAQAYIDNSRKSSTEELDVKSLEDQLGQIRRDLQALRAMLEPEITLINTPSIDHLKSLLPPAVKIFVATPFFYKHLASAESFALVLTKSGLVPTEAYKKNLPFRHNLLSNIPALLVQGRSDLLRHIYKSQKDKATLGRTINQWYKGQQVAVTEGHVTWWSILWQAMKVPNVSNPSDSKANSFASKLKRYGDSLAADAATTHLAGGYKRNGRLTITREIHTSWSLFDMVASKMKRHSGIRTTGQNTLSDHTMQAVCSEVVDDPANNLSFASRVADAVQEIGENSGKARKKKRTEDPQR
ncbi:hypothetical protein MVLG_06965 [Microbotryum lychnidis-dioicae p1A1 Lamole]|uniref:Uncharacterized protein n=1 Tax=Microbotryum lychnidis-dioicae (strain p1A1 Lamole / MvSl-1064) TaxID=683840 RepID=U5HIW7_USTV1|nr:hypothetical protein MVLG_06965 [Microbotryum lychnidis-dioicae p1A1 Lamole]|eukprot:KDE02485.1 hypothetical protein MVLG_06965 [Microbotryum lychnidis-dioicae p1A1 Lamole]